MSMTTMADGDAPRITFELVTLFPEMFDGLLATTVIGKAIAAGTVAVHRTNPRDFGLGNYRQVDDTPYGGGPGMIMRVEPIAAALDAIATARGPSHRVLLTPRGRRFDQDMARALAARPRVTLVCGRYEGVDERVSSLVDDQICIGDFVLAGGELAAAVVLEATARWSPACSAAACRRGRIVHVRAPRIPAVDPSRRLERAGRAAGAALGRPQGDRGLAPAGRPSG
jgi:tRNA (guanine-N1)-methyltransferase